MKTYKLSLILSLFMALIFTSCEKNDQEDDSRFDNIGQVTASVDGKPFTSRSVTIEAYRIDPDDMKTSLKFSATNILGEIITFHITNVESIENSYLLSNQPLLVIEGINYFNSATYQLSAYNEEDEYSSKKNPTVAGEINQISVSLLGEKASGAFEFKGLNPSGDQKQISQGLFTEIPVKNYQLLIGYWEWLALQP